MDLQDGEREGRVWAHILDRKESPHRWPLRAAREGELLGYVQRFAAKGHAQGVLSAVEDFCRARKLWLKVAGGDKAAVLEKVVDVLKPKSVLEVGSYVGFSAIRLGAAVQRWGGQVVSLEMDPVLALIARQMVAHAGLEAVVQIQLGHSEVRLDRLCGSSSFDLVFFDQRGSRFREDLEKLEEMGALHPKAVLIADNVLKPGAPTFLWYVCAAPGWRSLIVELGDFGPCGVLDWMSVSQKVAAEQRSQESPELPEKIQHLAWQADGMRWSFLAAEVLRLP